MSPRGVVVDVLDSDVVISELELQSCYYIHFRTNALRKYTGWIVSLLFFYNDGFGIK